MRISNVSIRGYRTIQEELSFPVRGLSTFVGPNNSGKTNTLKAIQSFFTGYENRYRYLHSEDACKGVRGIKTNIQITFSDIGEPGDEDVQDALIQVRQLLGVTTGGDDEVTLYLTFSEASNPSYRAFPNTRRPKGSEAASYSRAERRLFDLILDRFSVHYIPSEKSIIELYETLVQPFLARELSAAIKSDVGKLNKALNDVSKAINEHLARSGIADLKAVFSLPDEIDRIFGEVDFKIEDVQSTSAYAKGMGVQSAVLLSCLCWIAEKERGDGLIPVWLLEEPESYLHPELMEQCFKIIRTLGDHSHVFTTTHALGFVPSDPLEVVGMSIDNGWTLSERFQTYHEATESIRTSLGVKFGDFFNLSEFNLFVEGKTDKAYLEAAIKGLGNDSDFKTYCSVLQSSGLAIRDFGGVKGLEGFLRATFDFIRKERSTVSLFDGDTAGEKSRKDLVQYFGQKRIPFQANRQYVVVRDRFAIEGLFPDDWLEQAFSDHPSWFTDDLPKDAQGAILPFGVKDQHKAKLSAYFIERMTTEPSASWSVRWLPVLKALSGALQAQGKSRAP